LAASPAGRSPGYDHHRVGEFLRAGGAEVTVVVEVRPGPVRRQRLAVTHALYRKLWADSLHLSSHRLFRFDLRAPGHDGRPGISPRSTSMQQIYDAFATALRLIVTLDPGLVEIVRLSLEVSLLAVGLAAIIGLPLGGAVVLFAFPGRRALVVLLNSLMGLPPVIVGLVVYLLLSRAGPFGVLGLLFSPAAMILAQTILVTPIVAALARQFLEDLWSEYADQLHSLGAHHGQALLTLLWEGRFSLTTAVLAGFGRASAEVGAVMIVGGNIEHATRTMTTAIALETSKGDLSLALGLGLLLMLLSLAINGAAYLIRDLAGRRL
jgi:tungstate transport system permease protein